MSEHDELSVDEASAESPNPGPAAHAEESAEPSEAGAPPIPAQLSLPAPGEPELPAAPESDERPERQPGMLTLIPTSIYTESMPPPRSAARGGFVNFRVLAAAAAALAIVVALGAATLIERDREAALLTTRTQETEALAQTVKSLKARLDGLESAKSRDETADIRKTIGELKSTVASARDLSGAVALLNQKVERIDHDETSRVDKLGERVDHETAAKSADLAARIEKLEKKVANPVVASTAPAPQPQEAGIAPAKPNPGVSMETTGSIDKPKQVLHNFTVLAAREGVALISTRFGPQEVRPGDFIPGAGRVDRIERRARDWVVLTNLGTIESAEPQAF
jgi:hypothetical protein